MATEAARLYVTVGADVRSAVAGLQQVETVVQRMARSRGSDVRVNADTTGAIRSIQQVERGVRSLSGKAVKIDADTRPIEGKLASLKQKITSNQGLLGGIVGGVVGAGSMMAISGVTAAVTGMFNAMIHGAAQVEKFETSFEVLLGSMDKAKARMAELREFAKTTPFELPEVVSASRTLEVFTKGVLSAGEGLRLVGDIAAGTGQRFDEIAMWIGRTYDAMQSGRPFGEAAMRLQEMGAIGGEGRAKLEKLAQSVKSGAMTMEVAWKAAGAEFGRFSGMMEKQSRTLEGQWSNLADAFGQLMTKVGTALLPIIKDVVAGTITLVEALSQALEKASAMAQSLADSVVDALQNITGATESEAKKQGDILLNFFLPWEYWPGVINAVTWAYNEFKKAIGQGPNIPDLSADVTNAIRSAERAASAEAFTFKKTADDLASALPRAMGEAAKEAAKIARQTPGEMAAALRAGRTSWMEGVQTFITDLRAAMSPMQEAAFAIGFLTSKQLQEGLDSDDASVRYETNQLVKEVINRLIALVGPVSVAGWDLGSAAVNSIRDALIAGRDIIGRLPGRPDGGVWTENVIPMPKKPTRKDYEELGWDWVYGLGQGIKSGGSQVDAALETLKAKFDAFQSWLDAFPSRSASGIATALRQTITLLSRAIGGMDLGERLSAYAELGEQVTAGAAAAALPPEARKYAEAIDKLRGYILNLDSAIQKTTDAAQRQKYLDRIATFVARIAEYSKIIDQITSDAENVAAGAAGKAAGAVGSAISDQIAASMDEATKTQIAAWEAEIGRYEAAIAKLKQYIATLSAVAKPTADQLKWLNEYVRRLGEYEARISWLQGNVDYAIGQAKAAAEAAQAASAQPIEVGVTPEVGYEQTAYEGGTTYNINVGADIDINGPVLDPYGDYAQKLAALLIPGIQRELARQGISL